MPASLVPSAQRSQHATTRANRLPPHSCLASPCIHTHSTTHRSRPPRRAAQHDQAGRAGRAGGLELALTGGGGARLRVRVRAPACWDAASFLPALHCCPFVARALGDTQGCKRCIPKPDPQYHQHHHLHHYQHHHQQHHHHHHLATRSSRATRRSSSGRRSSATLRTTPKSSSTSSSPQGRRSGASSRRS